ncbi:MAG: M56 family metallopeptidase [Acidimicrobiales bacterium]
MTWPLVLPAVAAIVAGLGAVIVQGRRRPALGVPVMAGVATVCAVAVTGVLALFSIGFLAQVQWVADRVGWCRSFSRTHDAVPTWLGISASVTLVVMAAAVVRAAARRRRAIARLAGGSSIQLLATTEAVAFAVPGRPGHIVVSQGMLTVLDEQEQEVLFAHERSHLDRRHHIYLGIGHLAAAAVPFLRPLATELRFATERWADEDAAAAVGDRRVVARAIARAALAANAAVTAGALSLSQHGVKARVDALLAEPPSSTTMEATLAAGLGGLVLAVASSAVQLHHLLAFAAHVCRL